MAGVGGDRGERLKVWKMTGVGERFSARWSSHQANDNATDPVARRNERGEVPAKHCKSPKHENFRQIGDLIKFYE